MKKLNFTDFERETLNEFLAVLQSQMANSMCNDFFFPDDWTEEQKNAFSKTVFESLNEEYEEGWYPQDFMVLQYLIQKLQPFVEGTMTKYIDKADAIAADEIYEFLNREGLDHKIIDEYGVWRWETDPTIKMLYDLGMISLNTLADKIPNFRNDPRIRDLYRQLGISLYGYWETFHWEANNEHADEYRGE